MPAQAGLDDLLRGPNIVPTDRQRAMQRQMLAIRLPRLELRRARLRHELKGHGDEEDAEGDADQDQADAKVRLEDRQRSLRSFEPRSEPPRILSSSSSSCLPEPKTNRPCLSVHASRTAI